MCSACSVGYECPISSALTRAVCCSGAVVPVCCACGATDAVGVCPVPVEAQRCGVRRCACACCSRGVPGVCRYSSTGVCGYSSTGVCPPVLAARCRCCCCGAAPAPGPVPALGPSPTRHVEPQRVGLVWWQRAVPVPCWSPVQALMHCQPLRASTAPVYAQCQRRCQRSAGPRQCPSRCRCQCKSRCQSQCRCHCR